jgi:hypothetical protein
MDLLVRLENNANKNFESIASYAIANIQCESGKLWQGEVLQAQPQI